MSTLYTPDGFKVPPKRAAPVNNMAQVLGKLERVMGLPVGSRFPQNEVGAVSLKPEDSMTVALTCALALEKSGVLDRAVVAVELEAARNDLASATSELRTMSAELAIAKAEGASLREKLAEAARQAREAAAH
jgi:hypothetical protein